MIEDDLSQYGNGFSTVSCGARDFPGKSLVNADYHCYHYPSKKASVVG
jgi:hypothetical protein